jgi:uncharacterized protein (DUF1697 family)
MKTKYIALLRGINVGGNNIIKMEYLKKSFINLGFDDVKTYIQSGNVIFYCNADFPNIAQSIEKQLLNDFSVDIKVLVLSAEELQEIVENCPENFGKEPDKFRYDVWFLLPPLTPKEVINSVRLKENVDAVCAGKNVIYASRLIEKASQSFTLKLIQMPIYKFMTIRNWNTTQKLLNF